MEGDPIWRPTPQQVEGANITRFRRLIEERHDLRFGDYTEFHRWSCDRLGMFWKEVWDYCQVVGDRSDEVVRHHPGSFAADWFPGSRLNFAENLLRHSSADPAIIFYAETGLRREMSFRELGEQSAAVSSFLKDRGIVAGDRVAGYLPNLPEAVVAMLGTAALGAIWSATSPDFGVEGARERLEQIQPRVLFTADGYFYSGKRISLEEKVRTLVEALPSVEVVVVVSYLDEKVELRGIECRQYRDLLQPASHSWMRFPFDHPLAILYSSGTTGVPKCIVHGAGGTLLQHLKELILHTDLRPGERIFYYTSCGWMMWNWLVSSLAVGGTIFLYDGSPFYPVESTLFDIAEREGVNVFGTSAKFLMAAEKAGVVPRERGNFAPLRAVLSTGSPLPSASFDYVYTQWKSDLMLSSISGGTDIISCFALGHPGLPVYRGELQAPGLGMDIAVFDDSGGELLTGPGELVCRKPFPSMPVSFWNDAAGERYRSAYFTMFPSVWRHGDWVEWTEHYGMVVYGRSDAVLNPGGVRIGTAEIYRAVEALPEVLESIAVGQKWDNDERILLFVKLRPDEELTPGLEERIRQAIRERNTQRHVPARVFAIPDIPKTVNGKIVELAVKDIIHGRPVKNRDALANPSALDYFRALPGLDS